MSTEHPELRQEDDRVSGLPVVLGALVVLTISAVMVVWAWTATDTYVARLRPSMSFPEERLGPRRPMQGLSVALFGDEPGAGELLNARQRRSLDVYRWLDPDRRIVTLPIDRAMDRIARESTP